MRWLACSRRNSSISAPAKVTSSRSVAAISSLRFAGHGHGDLARCRMPPDSSADISRPLREGIHALNISPPLALFFTVVSWD